MSTHNKTIIKITIKAITKIEIVKMIYNNKMKIKMKISKMQGKVV